MKFIAPLFKVFVPLISLSQVGNAILNNISFKNISKQFKPEYQQYSPVLGKVALERGLIYNLRFFGNLTEGVKEGRREYVSDKSNDPLMQLLILLFPSSAGNLASSSEGISNFGKYATPEMVATLLNFADSCRRFLPHASELEAETQAINDKKAEAIKSLKRDRRFYTDEKIRNVAEQAFKEKEEISKKYYKIDYDKYKKRFKKLFDPFFYNLSRRGLLLLSENVDNILLLVENSIKNEISAQSENIYPTYTTEQVILAFFCHKFNTKSDLWVFLSHLNP